MVKFSLRMRIGMCRCTCHMPMHMPFAVNSVGEEPQNRALWQLRWSSSPSQCTQPNSFFINKSAWEQSVAQSVNSQRNKFQRYLWNKTIDIASCLANYHYHLFGIQDFTPVFKFLYCSPWYKHGKEI